MPLLRAHGVNVSLPLLIDSRTHIEITWDPEDVLPLDDDPLAYTVDVHVYTYEYSQTSWRRRSSNKNLVNNGQAVLGRSIFSADVKVVCIHVAAGASNSSSDNTSNIIESLNALSDRPFPFQAGIWSGLLFSIKNVETNDENIARAVRNFGLDGDCRKWDEQQSSLPNENVFANLPACPPTQDRAELPNSGLEEARYDSVLYDTDYHTQWMQTFHPGATVCFTQATVNRQVITVMRNNLLLHNISCSDDPEQECCYDESGNLLVGSPDGGSANRYAPVDFTTYHEHIQHDLVPRSFCCPRNCITYYRWRPSDDGSKYSPLPPGQCTPINKHCNVL